MPEVEVATEGEVVVEADHLAAIVRESTEDVLVLGVTETSCEIRGLDSKFTLYTQDPKQFPKVPVFEEGKADIEVTLENLQVGTTQCLFATAKESSRYAINGVLWETKGKKLFLVATDGRRLARSRVELQSAASDAFTKQKIIVPSRTMAILEKITLHSEDVVSARLVDNQVLIRCGNIVISSTLVEGNFPKYEDIVPKDYDKKITLSTQQALSAVRRAALLTSEESKGVKLSIGSNSLVFSGGSPETGDAEVTMQITYKGDPIEIGFNPQFLVDALRVIRAADFEMELGQADRPGVIKSDNDFLYVLMPINLG
jgi:DNA polymerase-3 subunit beta